MATRRASWIGLAAAILSSGCHDAAGPCDKPHACEIDGPDLAIVAAEVLADSGYLSTGVPIASPGAIRVRYVVRNRGSEGAAAAVVTAQLAASVDSDSLPVLLPGDSTAGLLIIAWPDAHMDYYGAKDSTSVQLSIEQGRDSDSANDARAVWMHPGLPLLALNFPDQEVGRVRVGDPFDVHFTIENRSEQVTAAGYSVWLCVNEYGEMCCPGRFAPFAETAVPDIPPGGAHSGGYVATVEPMGAWQDESTEGRIAMCIRPSGWDDPYMRAWHTCVTRDTIAVLPDFEACSPPRLVPGVPLTLSQHNCGLLPLATRGDTARYNAEIRLYRTHLFALELQAGHTYHLDWTSTPSHFLLDDADGNHGAEHESGDPIVVAHDGRYYLTVYDHDAVVTVTLQDDQ